ncbi:MAG: ABC transporter substrate-binding protein, partial [Thiohalocapsa sp.]
LVPKRIDLLSDMLPQAKTFALMMNPRNSNADRMVGYALEAAQAKRLRFETVKASTDAELDAAFEALRQIRADGLVVGADSFLYTHAAQIGALCVRHSLAASAESRQFAVAGGLMSYGTDYAAVYEQVGAYTGRILHGEKPTDLPVQQPAKFELVINLEAAKALGLTVPPFLLARADDVIE